AETELCAGGLGGEPHQAYLPGLAVPTPGGTPGQEAGSGRRGALDAGDFLPYAQRPHDLQRLRRRLLRPSRARTPDPVLRQAPGRSRSQGDARIQRPCLTEIFGAELSGHVALRHPQSNENGRYERGEALTENKALSAYFQGRTVRRAVPGAAPAKRRSWRRAPGPEPPARWACSPPRAGSGTRKPAARDAPTAAGHRPGQP